MELLVDELDKMLMILPPTCSDYGQTFTISGIKDTSASYLDAGEMRVRRGLHVS